MARKIILDDDEDDVEDNPSEMQISEGSDVEVEADDDAAANENQEAEEAEDQVDVEEEDGSDKDGEEEPEDDSDLDALSSPPPDATEIESIPHPKLKIKLKLPTGAGLSTATTATPTPESTSRAPSRRAASRDINIESEDSDDDAHSMRSTSVATTVTPARALTARQAVLRNVVDSSHVSLIEPPNPRKKKPLTEIEIALKREETARKRKNLTEKKLEDEKAETINRLLKKQSRAKGRRNALATAEDRDTPVAAASRGEAEDEEGQEGSAVPTPVIPTMYRWVSRVNSVDSNADAEEGKRMALSFSVPVNVLPTPEDAASSDVKMDVDTPPRKTRHMIFPHNPENLYAMSPGAENRGNTG